MSAAIKQTASPSHVDAIHRIAERVLDLLWAKQSLEASIPPRTEFSEILVDASAIMGLELAAMMKVAGMTSVLSPKYKCAIEVTEAGIPKISAWE